MLIFRSVLFYLGVTLFTVPHTLIAPLLWLTPKRLRRSYLGLWAHFTIFWLSMTCNLRYEVIGKENIPQTNSIILAKHQSAWETIAMQLIFPTQTWVLKRELLFLPFFGWGLAMTEPVAINRASGKKALRQVIKQGTDRLKRGLWLVIFPEGTRTAFGSKGKYAIGGALLAEKSGFPVVPVAHNAGKYWPKDSFIKYPGTITLSIAPMIDSSQLKAKAINQLAEDWIESQSFISN